MTISASIFTSAVQFRVFFKQISQSSPLTVFWVVPQGGLGTHWLWGLLGCCWGRRAAPTLQLLMGINAADQERAGSPWPAGWIKCPCKSFTTVGFAPQIHTTSIADLFPRPPLPVRLVEIPLWSPTCRCWKWDFLMGRKGVTTPMLGK